MAEYIDREATIEFIRLNYCKDCNSYNGVRCRACSFDDAMLAIEDVPTADVVEVKHGYWKPSPDGINPIRCSVCNMPAPFAAGSNEFGDFEVRRYPSKYCHECGAIMDGRRAANGNAENKT